MQHIVLYHMMLTLGYLIINRFTRTGDNTTYVKKLGVTADHPHIYIYIYTHTHTYTAAAAAAVLARTGDLRGLAALQRAVLAIDIIPEYITLLYYLILYYVACGDILYYIILHDIIMLYCIR